MDISGKKYYLANICPYLHIINGSLKSNRVIVGETEHVFPYLFENTELPVKVHGKLKVIKIKQPLIKKPNAPTKEVKINVIIVSDLEVIKK